MKSLLNRWRAKRFIRLSKKCDIVVDVGRDPFTGDVVALRMSFDFGPGAVVSDNLFHPIPPSYTERDKELLN